ncbi:MAG: potassium channel family protein [Candidatus Saccharibacteria bacterium]
MEKSTQANINQTLATAKRFRWVALIGAALLGIGTVFYHFQEKLSWLDSLYFSTITLTTIGYGDIVPHTPLGKLFTIFYVLIGVGVIAAILNILVKGAAQRRIERFSSKHGRQNDTLQD